MRSELEGLDGAGWRCPAVRLQPDAPYEEV
jgi:hypothetical protein